MIRTFRSFVFAFLPGLLLTALSASAELRLAAIFSDHMVLQREQPIPVWGWADPGEEVTLRFRDQSVTTAARADGRWSATLAAEGVGEPADLVVVSGEEVVVQDVLVGDVWLASGQSNMEWKVADSDRAEATIAAAGNPLIRLFTVPHRVSTEPLDDVEGAWRVASPDTVAPFSAVAWFFGREIQKRQKVPVGLIHTSWGGTPAEAWTGLEALAAKPGLTRLVDQRTRDLVDYPQRLVEYRAAVHGWELRQAQAAATGSPFTERKPDEPRGPHHKSLAAGLFNAMIHPLIPYATRGTIWYQGEANAAQPEEYAILFPTLIEDWRSLWGQGDFPFLFVQLADFRVDWDSSGRIWAFLREAQTQALRLPKTGMAVTIDIGNPDDIHPRNKHDVGKRLALVARSVAYGESVPASGPTYRGMTVEGSAVRIALDHAETGLMTKGPTLLGFEVAGQDRRWVPAKAIIDGVKVVVHSPEVAEPVAVRYAWRNSPEATLTNGAGLPAAPFRTDDWPRNDG
ncbi:MAG: sialate O-acetylesterase [Opitutaceae bacterium]